MNDLHRVAMVATGVMMLAGAAWAQVPDPGASVKPRGIALVGSDGMGPGHPDPGGVATFWIWDQSGNPLPGAWVTLDFSRCPQIRLCSNQQSPGIVVNCLAKTVTGTTDVNGYLRLSLSGTVDQAGYISDQDFPEPDPLPPVPGSQNYFGCCQVTVAPPSAPGLMVPFPALIAAAYDHEVLNPGVGSGDLSRCIADIISGNYRERSDYDVSVAGGGAGVLNSGDLARMIAIANGGGSTNSCTPPQGGSPCP